MNFPGTRQTACAAVLCMPLLTQAQIVINAALAALQPTVMRDERGFKSCGVRAVVVVGETIQTMESYDFSMNIYADSVSGMIKAGKYTQVELARTKPGGTVKAVQPAPISFWIARADQGKAAKPKLIIPAESPGFILGAMDLGATLEVMLDTANGAKMQFVTRYGHEHLDRVISFSSKMGAEDLATLNLCLAGLRARLEASIDQPEQNMPAASK